VGCRGGGNPGLVVKSWRPAASHKKNPRALFPQNRKTMKNHGNCHMQASIDDSDSVQGFEQIVVSLFLGPIGDTVGTTVRREDL